jgi:hypothetical protein
MAATGSAAKADDDSVDGCGPGLDREILDVAELAAVSRSTACMPIRLVRR